MKRFFSLFNVLSLVLLLTAAYALQAVKQPPETPPPPRLDLADRTDVKVKIYFTDSQVESIRPEDRTVRVVQQMPSEVAQEALKLWVKGPQSGDLVAVVPKGTPVPSVWLRGGHFFVNLPEEYSKLRYGSSGERVLLCSLSRTLLGIKGTDVTFLLAGQNADTLGHLDLREPYKSQDCSDQ